MPSRAASERMRVRRTISTLCALREAQDASRRCDAKADHTMDLVATHRQRQAMLRKCDSLAQRLARLEAPRRATRLRRHVEDEFDAGRLVTASAEEVQGVAIIAPGMCTAASRVSDLQSMLKVLRYLESRPRWKQMALRASPHPAVPRFVSVHHRFATLQNLPSWQSARITLVACALATRAHARRCVGPSELEKWFRALNVYELYVPTLRTLRSEVAGT